MAYHGVPYNGPYSNVAVTTGSFVSSTHNITINTAPPSAICISDPSTTRPVLTIHYDGRIEYAGKPSAAANAFYKSLCSSIDIKAAGKRALEKTYRRAIKRCLNQAKTMSREDFIVMLEKELDARTSKAVLNTLTEDDINAE